MPGCSGIVKPWSCEDRTTVGFDVRAIVAADGTYDQAVEEGRVRIDLHRVISTVRIDVPPLRARRDDIPSLTRHVLAAIGRPIRCTTQDTQ